MESFKISPIKDHYEIVMVFLLPKNVLSLYIEHKRGANKAENIP